MLTRLGQDRSAWILSGRPPSYTHYSISCLSSLLSYATRIYSEGPLAFHSVVLEDPPKAPQEFYPNARVHKVLFMNRSPHQSPNVHELKIYFQTTWYKFLSLLCNGEATPATTLEGRAIPAQKQPPFFLRPTVRLSQNHHQKPKKLLPVWKDQLLAALITVKVPTGSWFYCESTI